MRTALTGMRSCLGALRRMLVANSASELARAKDAEIRESLRRFVQERAGSGRTPRESVLQPEIIIPCFNHGRFLGQALEPIAGSGLPVTIINDFSTDDTPKHIARLRERFSFALIDNKASLLQWGSLNKAISTSASNLFIVLNADDVFLPYTLDLILRTFETRTEIRMLGGSCIPFVDDAILRLSNALPRQLNYEPSLRMYDPEEAKTFQSLNDLNMTMSSCSFLRSAWEAAGGFRAFADRVCSYDDRDFQMRVAALFPVAVMDEPLAFYRTSSSMGRARI